MKNRRPLITSIAIILGFVIVLSATYAWFATRQSVPNEFKTANIDNVIVVEKFDPPTEWVPGMTVEKKALVAQTGTGDVVVRVKLTELLSMLETETVDSKVRLKVYKNVIDDATLQAGAVPLATAKSAITAAEALYGGTWATVNASSLSTAAADINGLVVRTNGTQILAYYENGSDIRQVIVVKSTVMGEENDLSKATFVFPYYKKTADKIAVHGMTPEDIDHAMIHINFNDPNVVANITGWSGESENWYYGGDGYYYYGAILSTGEATKNLLESVKLDESAGEEYKNINYTLTVNMEAVQATKAAVQAEWAGMNSGVYSVLSNFLAN